MDAACAEAVNPVKDKKHSTTVNKAICTCFECLCSKRQLKPIKKNFDEVLALKDRLFKATGLRIVPRRLHWGRKYLYPFELLRLNYYSAKKKLDKFNHLLLII